MTPVVIRYKLDPTGTNPNNLVQGEVHQMVRRKVRSIATRYGAFFSESLRIIDTASNKELTRGVHYITTEMYEAPTARFGKEICAIILIVDETVSDAVAVQYQAVGGEFSTSVTAIEQLITALNLDDRPVSKDSIVDWPSEFPPSHHLHDAGDTYGWEYVVNSLTKILSALKAGKSARNDAIYAYIDMIAKNVTPEVVAKILDTVNTAMAAHLAAPDPHPQYMTKLEAAAFQMPYVKKPTNRAPVNGADSAGGSITLTMSVFYTLYGVAQQSAQFRVSKREDMSGPYDFDITAGAVNQVALPGILPANTLYYWSGRYQDADGIWSDWSDVTHFNTGNISVTRPTVTSPANGSDIVVNGLTITASDFATNGYPDTHAKSDWEVWTGPDGTGVKVFSSYNDATNKTSIKIAANVLANNVTYYPRVRYYGASLGASPYSAPVSFNVKYPPFPSTLGELFAGGYYAGDYTFGGSTYAVLVAPKASGQSTQQLSTKTTQYAGNDQDSVLDTNNLKAFGSAAANWVAGLTIAGFADWVIPSLEVMKLVSANLNPAGGVTPALFKSGGSEALTASPYWTSSPYDHVVDNSYYDPDTPIYGSSTSKYEDSRSFNYGPTGESVNYNPYVKCSPGEAGPNNVRGPNFSTNGTTSSATGEYIGYWSAAWTCTVTSTDTVIIGYQPGAYHQVLTNTYDARYVNVNGSAVGYATKATSYLVRAVRLVKKS